MTVDVQPLLGAVAVERVALAGDWHGNYVFAAKAIEWAVEHEAQAIVQLGDFGLWPGVHGDKYLRRLNRLLAGHDLFLFWVDGNHDNHARLARTPIDPDTGLRRFGERVRHLPRGHRWTFTDTAGDTYTWMALGGAVSLDKQWRFEGKDWWPGETISEADAATARRGGAVDVMLTHDCPAGVNVRGTSNDWPRAQLEETRQHRDLLRGVVDAVHPSRLWHGHFHVRHAAKIAYVNWPIPCHVEGLGADVGHLLDNVTVVDASGATVQLAGSS